MSTNAKAQENARWELRLLDAPELEVAGGTPQPLPGPLPGSSPGLKSAIISGPCALWSPAWQWIACGYDSCGCP
jgi:hypothetical protein